MCTRALLAFSGAIALVGSALAAELTPPPPPPAPAVTWAGGYYGLQFGYAWGRDDASRTGTGINFNSAGGSFSSSLQGVIGGAHLGYNFQPNPWLVLGLEDTIDGTSSRKSVVAPVASFAGGTFGTISENSSARIRGSVRGRLGIARDRVLLYGTGGLASTNSNSNYTDTTGFFTGFPGV